jgi:hypothetical protein
MKITKRRQAEIEEKFKKFLEDGENPIPLENPFKDSQVKFLDLGDQPPQNSIPVAVVKHASKEYFAFIVPK